MFHIFNRFVALLIAGLVKLEELVKCTPPRNSAFEDPIEMALNVISALASGMNEGKRETESRQKLLHWQKRIRGRFPSPLVQPHR